MADKPAGRLLDWSPGLALADGLAGVAFGDRVDIEGSGPALVTALASDHVELAPLSSVAPPAGAPVHPGGRLTIPAGDGFVGRSVDALGRPLDGGGAIREDGRSTLFFPAPPLRPEPERRRMTLGLWVYDFQQQVHLGSTVLASGSTPEVARHLLRHQAQEGRVCIHARLTPAAERNERFIVLEPGPAPAPAAIWMIPWTAMAMAAHFRDQGRHAVVLLESLDRWRTSALERPSLGSWQTQLGRLLGQAYAADHGSASLLALASPELARPVESMLDVVLDLNRALEGFPRSDLGKIVRSPYKLPDPGLVGSALAALAELEAVERRTPWLLPALKLDRAQRLREALRFRPGMSADLAEQLLVFYAVGSWNDVAPAAVPDLLPQVLKVLVRVPGLAEGIRSRRELRADTLAGFVQLAVPRR